MSPAPDTRDSPAVPVYRDAESARDWVDAEVRCVIAVVEHAAGHGHGDASRTILWGLTALWHHAYWRSDWVMIGRVAAAARLAASRVPDPRLSAWANIVRGRGETEAGRAAQGMAYFRRALAQYETIEDWLGVAQCHVGLGIASQHRGDLAAAVRCFEESLAVSRLYGIAAGEALALVNLGRANCLLGRFDQALAAATGALEFRRMSGDAQGIAATCYVLGAAHTGRGELERAQACAEEALSLAREVGDHLCEQETVLLRSEVHLRFGRLAEAIRDVDEVLALARARGHRYAAMLAEQQRAKVGADAIASTPPSTAALRAVVVAEPWRDLLLEWLLFGWTPGGDEPAAT